MSGLFWLSYALRSLRRGGRRTLFALLCVLVGVAGVVALQTASLTVQDALTSNVRAANGGDVSLTSQEAPLSRSDLSIFERLQRQGRISQWTAVSSVHATAVGPKQALVPFDVNLIQAPPYPVGGQPTFVSPAGGNVATLMAHRGDVLVTSVLAEELGVGVGSRLRVNGLGGAGLDAVVRGVTSETSFEHSAILTVQRSEAAALTDRPLTYSAVLINVRSGQAAPVAAELRNAFPSATVSTVQDALQSAQLQVHDFRQFLLLVALFALLIAGIGILNAMQSILAWRRLEIAMLKAIGFRQGVLYLLFGGEALILGLLGGLLGTVVGAFASKTISDALARAMAIQINYRLDTVTLLDGVALGAVTTLVFAILPIVRAASFRPLEILREGTGSTAAGWLQTVGLLALALLLFGALAAAIVGDTLVAAEFVLAAFAVCAVLTGLFSLVVGWINGLGRPSSPPVGYAVLAVLVALTVIVVVKIPALSAIIALCAIVWLITMVFPQSWLLHLLIAARSLARRRARTSVTLVAFLAGILAMTVTMTVALSLQSQINQALAAAGKTNLVAVANPTNEGDVLRTARTLPGIQSRTITAYVGTEATTVHGRPLAATIGPAQSDPQNADQNDVGRFFGGVTGYDLARGDAPAGIQITAGRALQSRDAGTAHVLLRTGLQDPPFNLAVGDRVTLKGTSSLRTRTVQVVGFYQRPRRARGFGSFFMAPILGDRILATTLGGADTQSIIGFVVDRSRLTHDAASIQRAVPGALIIDVGDLTAVVETILNELLNLLAVITALVLGAGLAVVANGVALAMFERRREIAIFKAVGFGPSTVLRFVLVENAFVGTIAGAASVLGAAIALGVLSRMALQQAIGFDPLVAVYVLIVAAALAIVTAYLAARTPVRMRPLEALRND